MELSLPFLERRHAWKKQNKQGLIFPFQSNALSRTHSQVRIPQPYRVLNLHCSPNSFQCLEPSLTLQDRQSVSGHFKGKLVFFQFLFFFLQGSAWVINYDPMTSGLLQGQTLEFPAFIFFHSLHRFCLLQYFLV